MLILLYFIEFISELVERAKRFVAKIGMTAEEKARAREQIAKLERAKELYTSAYRATMNAVSERANAQNSQNNAETKVPVGYNGSVSHSLKNNNSDVTNKEHHYTEREYRNFGWARANNILMQGKTPTIVLSLLMQNRAERSSTKVKKANISYP